MSKHTKILLGLVLGVSTLGFGDVSMSAAASRAWVTNFVAQAIKGSLGEMTASSTVSEIDDLVTISVGDGVLTMEKQTDAALLVTNVTSAAISSGITNTLMAVWNGSGKYINPAFTVTATATNLIFEGVGSVETNGLIHFERWFDALPVLIQPSQAFSITNSTEIMR